MKLLAFSATLIATFLVSCATSSHQYPIKKVNRLLGSSGNSSTISLSNSGTLCAYKPNNNIMVLKYYPLSTSCASSSVYNWKLNGLETKIDSDKVVVNSYSLYKKNNSPIATTDCAGAGVRVKRVATKTANTILYWGSHKLDTISPNQDMKCFKRVGSGYVKVEPIQ